MEAEAERRYNMWDWVLPLAAMAGFILLWWVILPAAGIRT
jgi:hypothetical protein